MFRTLIFLAALAAGWASCAQQPASAQSLYVVDHYDPARNPEADLALAAQRASAEGKRILVVVGGDWCVWCEILDRFIAANSDVHAAFADSFVVLKVNFGRENENEAFLRRFPQSEGYPNFFILAADGAYLAQQDTALLEQGRSYNRARMLAFAGRWRMRQP